MEELVPSFWSNNEKNCSLVLGTVLFPFNEFKYNFVSILNFYCFVEEFEFGSTSVFFLLTKELLVFHCNYILTFSLEFMIIINIVRISSNHVFFKGCCCMNGLVLKTILWKQALSLFCSYCVPSVQHKIVQFCQYVVALLCCQVEDPRALDLVCAFGEECGPEHNIWGDRFRIKGDYGSR